MLGSESCKRASVGGGYASFPCYRVGMSAPDNTQLAVRIAKLGEAVARIEHRLEEATSPIRDRALGTIYFCDNCQYWDSASLVSGQCRRRAPIINPGPNDDMALKWPVTNPKTWCGDHLPTP